MLSSYLKNTDNHICLIVLDFEMITSGIEVYLQNRGILFVNDCQLNAFYTLFTLTIIQWIVLNNTKINECPNMLLFENNPLPICNVLIYGQYGVENPWVIRTRANGQHF